MIARVLKLLRQPQRIPSLMGMHARIQAKKWAKRRLDIADERERLLTFLTTQSGVDARSLLAAHLESPFKQAYRSRKAQLSDVARGSSSDFDVEALYLAVRCFCPAIVIETGVLYGASSSHILQALHENGMGQLISVDLPAKPNEPAQTFFVPEPLRERWTLHVGDSRVLLPKLFAETERINFFHHDSLHTYDHMLWEYQTAAAHFADNAILTSHDVMPMPFQKNPFLDFCRPIGVQFGIFRNLGVATGTWN